MLYPNILKILVFKVSIITNTRLIRVCFVVNLFCVYTYFIFNVYKFYFGIEVVYNEYFCTIVLF